jgi:hypothetical protein
MTPQGATYLGLLAVLRQGDLLDKRGQLRRARQNELVDDAEHLRRSRRQMPSRRG